VLCGGWEWIAFAVPVDMYSEEPKCTLRSDCVCRTSSVRLLSYSRSSSRWFSHSSHHLTIDAQLRLQLNTGLVIAVPVPSAEAADSTQIEQAISDALEEASYVLLRDSFSLLSLTFEPILIDPRFVFSSSLLCFISTAV